MLKCFYKSFFRQVWENCVPRGKYYRHIRSVIVIDPLVKNRPDYDWGDIIKYVSEMNVIYKKQIGVELNIEYFNATMQVCKNLYFLGTFPIHKKCN